MIIAPGPPRMLYVIDPQSGALLGPIELSGNDGLSVFKKAIELLGEEGYDTCPGEMRNPAHDLLPENWREGKKEAPPWWKDKLIPDDDPRKNDPRRDMWKRFRDALAACCAQSPPAPCGTGPNAQPPCTSPERYYLE